MLPLGQSLPPPWNCKILTGGECKFNTGSIFEHQLHIPEACGLSLTAEWKPFSQAHVVVLAWWRNAL